MLHEHIGPKRANAFPFVIDIDPDFASDMQPASPELDLQGMRVDGFQKAVAEGVVHLAEAADDLSTQSLLEQIDLPRAAWLPVIRWFPRHRRHRSNDRAGHHHRTIARRAPSAQASD